MDYITVKQAASNWNISIRQVQNYCMKGKIDGVVSFNGVWAIPKNASKPVDRRYRSVDKPSFENFIGTFDLDEDIGVFKNIIDLLPFRICILDANGFLIYANESFFAGAFPKARETLIRHYNVLQEPLLEKWGLTEHVHKAFLGECVYTPNLLFPSRDLLGSFYGKDQAFFTLYTDVKSFPFFSKNGILSYIVMIFIPVREYAATDAVMHAKEYIEVNWLEKFNTKSLAKTVFMSVSSLVRAFYNETGMTPHEYYTEVRVTRLKELLLRNPNISIAQAFYECGMDYNSYYTALFKKHIGLTPKQFKENNMQKI